MNRDDDIPVTSDGDPAVSRAYRGLAVERTPEHLDRAVLREAAAAKRRNDFRFGWLRPFAFVATVGLSLAVVLQITQSPQPATPFEQSMSVRDADVPAAPADELRQAPIAGGDPRPTARQQPAQAAAGKAVQTPAAASGMAAQSVPKKESEALSAEVDDARMRVQVLEESAALVESAGRVDATDAALFARLESLEAVALASPQEEKLDSGVDLAVSLSRSSRPAAEAAQAFNQAEADSNPGCGDDVRSTKSGWLACIRALIESGRSADAELELSQYESRYPVSDQSH